MYRSLVICIVIYSLYDVNLTTVGPRTFLAEGPEGGPCRTPLGHVLDVEHNDGLGVRVPRGYAYAVASPIVRTHYFGGICAHEEFVVRRCGAETVRGTRLCQRKGHDGPWVRLLFMAVFMST